MKYFFVSDIHGYFDKMVKKLNEINFDINNNDHMLCIAGDLFDNGPQQLKLFYWIRKNYNKEKILLVKGNHDDLHCQDWIFYDEAMKQEMKEIYKAKKINISFDMFVKKTCIEIKEFFKNIPYYIENKHFVLVHAGINPLLEDWRKGPKTGVDWTDSMTWMCYNHIKRIKNGAFKNFGKKVIAGHNWVEKLHFFYKNDCFPYEGNDFNYEDNNRVFQKDDFVCVDGKWNEEKSEGLVYIMEI